MRDWVPFDEGEYLVEKAFLLAPDDESAVFLENGMIRVSVDGRGQRQMSGRCRAPNLLMVRLLDDHDEIDLVLDLGGEFKYRLKDPIIKTGKVFSPGVKSALEFVPRTPWVQIPEDEFGALWAGLKPVSE
jgi:hypothetical protein